jgi:hypothetical protein
LGHDDLHLRTLAQTVGTVGHDVVAHGQVTLHAGPVAFGGTGTHTANGHCVVGLHGIHKCPLRPALQRGVGHGHGSGQHLQLQAHVHKLVGKQAAIGIGKLGLELDGAGGGINDVVGGDDPALPQPVAKFPIPHLHPQRLLAVQTRPNFGQQTFRHRKHQRNGLRLRDGDQPVGIAAAHSAAQVHLFQTHAPWNGSGQPGVRQLQLGVVHRCLIGLHGALQLAYQRILSVHLLAGNRIFGQQVFVPGQVQLGVAQLRLVTRQLALGLRQLHHLGTVVQLGQQLACLDGLPFKDPSLLKTDCPGQRPVGGGSSRFDVNDPATG